MNPLRRWLRRVMLVLGPASMILLLWGVRADTDALLPADGRFPAAGDTGVILLPGAGVEPRAYAPLAQAIAARGIPVRLVELPWRTAFTEAMTARLFAQIEGVARGGAGRWILAGHSRGAALAARYVHRYPDSVKGLVLMATTHPRDFDLSASGVPVLKIMGANDGMAPLAQARARAALLPAATRWVIIDGGNHSQFAHYHFQLFDGRAGISRAAQQLATVEAIAAFAREVR